MSEPTTEAGRALRRDIATETPIYEPEKAILAIEQEARREALAEVLAAVGEDLSRAADLMKPESLMSGLRGRPVGPVSSLKAWNHIEAALAALDAEVEKLA